MKEPPLVEFRNVTVVRGGRVALDGVSLSIGAGEHVAIVGPNGSGKSTLIKTITRECYPVQAPDSWLRIMGQDLWNIFDLRSLLGIVSADLLNNCSLEIEGEELIVSGYFGSLGLWPHQPVSVQMREKAAGIMQKLAIEHLARRSIHEMSSGELQRALIGRALVHDPKALVLDEPSNSLDVRARAELQEALRRLAAEGTGIVMVTHHLEDILPQIERVVLIKQGRLAGDGPKQRMLTSRRLSELFEVPVKVGRRDGRYFLR